MSSSPPATCRFLEPCERTAAQPSPGPQDETSGNSGVPGRLVRTRSRVTLRDGRVVVGIAVQRADRSLAVRLRSPERLRNRRWAAPTAARTWSATPPAGCPAGTAPGRWAWTALTAPGPRAAAAGVLVLRHHLLVVPVPGSAASATVGRYGDNGPPSCARIVASTRRRCAEVSSSARSPSQAR
jgi:hypothetical protein